MTNYINFLLPYGLYIGLAGVALGSVNLLLCWLLRYFTWSTQVANLIAILLTLLAMLASSLILGATMAWVWRFG